MVPVVGRVLVVVSAPARAACDVTGVDAAAIAAGRDAIDEACPCAAAASRRDYRRCATDVVTARVSAAELSRGCRRETLKHAKLSSADGRGRRSAAGCVWTDASGIASSRRRRSA